MRPAARLLLVEAEALRPILAAADPAAFDRPTVCTGWSVRDVLGHCGAALTRAATDALHGFTPDDNQRDVDERASWPIDAVLDELFNGYAMAAAKIDESGGRLDGIAVGEWVHGGDVREALGVGAPYASEGADLAVDLLVARSALLGRPCLEAVVGGRAVRFGAGGQAVGRLEADVATFVRLCGGRRPDSGRYTLTGCEESDLVLFT